MVTVSEKLMPQTSVLQQSKEEALPSQGMNWVGKYSLLSPWFEQILQLIKRDCKTEHLSIDPHFVRAHFAGKPVSRISLDEMRSVYLQQILSGHERLAEFIANRWLFRNIDMYRFFETELEKKVPQFDQIKELPQEVAESLIKEAKDRYGIESVFCFSVLNELALPRQVFEQLQKEALEAVSQYEKEGKAKLDSDEKQIELLKEEMKRLKEKQEKKIDELQRRHKQEVDRFSREIAALKDELKRVKEKNLAK